MPEILNRQAQGEVTHQGNFHYREMAEKRSKIGKKNSPKGIRRRRRHPINSISIFV